MLLNVMTLDFAQTAYNNFQKHFWAFLCLHISHIITLGVHRQKLQAYILHTIIIKYCITFFCLFVFLVSLRERYQNYPQIIFYFS